MMICDNCASKKGITRKELMLRLPYKCAKCEEYDMCRWYRE